MEVVKAFNNELSSLYEGKPPISKAKMTQLTRTAIKGIKFYKHVVQSVEKFIQKCRPEYKVPGLYVIDSIVRQSRHQFGLERDLFVPRFSKNIVSTFQCLYKCPPEEKPKIVKVLNLWQKNNVFPTEVIQPLLDMAHLDSSAMAAASVEVKAKSSGEDGSWKSWSAPSQPMETSAPQSGNAKDHTSEDAPVIDSSIISQLHEITSQLLTQPSDDVPRAKEENKPAVKFNKKLLDFDYGDEEEEVEEDDKEENGHATTREPNALALSMAQNLLSNPELLHQLQQMQQTIQLTEALKSDTKDSDKHTAIQDIRMPPTVPDISYSHQQITTHSNYSNATFSTSQSQMIHSDANASASLSSQMGISHHSSGGPYGVSPPLFPPMHQNYSSPVRNMMLPPTMPLEGDYPLSLHGLAGGVTASSGQMEVDPPSVAVEPALPLQDQDERQVWLKDSDEREKVKKDRSRSRSRSPRNRSSNRSSSSSKRHKRSRSKSPKRRRSSSRSPPRRDHRRDRRSDSKDYEREGGDNKEREKDRERRRLGLPVLKKGHFAVCSTTLWLGHVPKMAADVEVQEIFAKFGTVTSVDLIPPRGCAYICMERRQDASKALQKLRNLKIQSCSIKMAWAPGKGLKDKEFKDFWDAEQGVAFIPHEKTPSSSKLDQLAEGGMIDEESLPDNMRDRLKTGDASKEKQLEGAVKIQKDAEAKVVSIPLAQVPLPQSSMPPVTLAQVKLQQSSVKQVMQTVGPNEQQANLMAGMHMSMMPAMPMSTMNMPTMPMTTMSMTTMSMAPMGTQFGLPMSNMVTSQQMLLPQIPLPMGVPPPNPLMMMANHNRLLNPPPPLAVLNHLPPPNLTTAPPPLGTTPIPTASQKDSDQMDETSDATPTDEDNNRSKGVQAKDSSLTQTTSSLPTNFPSNPPTNLPLGFPAVFQTTRPPMANLQSPGGSNPLGLPPQWQTAPNGPVFARGPMPAFNPMHSPLMNPNTRMFTPPGGNAAQMHMGNRQLTLPPNSLGGGFGHAPSPGMHSRGNQDSGPQKPPGRQNSIPDEFENMSANSVPLGRPRGNFGSKSPPPASLLGQRDIRGPPPRMPGQNQMHPHPPDMNFRHQRPPMMPGFGGPRPGGRFPFGERPFMMRGPPGMGMRPRGMAPHPDRREEGFDPEWCGDRRPPHFGPMDRFEDERDFPRGWDREDDEMGHGRRPMDGRRKPDFCSPERNVFGPRKWNRDEERFPQRDDDRNFRPSNREGFDNRDDRRRSNSRGDRDARGMEFPDRERNRSFERDSNRDFDRSRDADRDRPPREERQEDNDKDRGRGRERRGRRESRWNRSRSRSRENSVSKNSGESSIKSDGFSKKQPEVVVLDGDSCSGIKDEGAGGEQTDEVSIVMDFNAVADLKTDTESKGSMSFGEEQSASPIEVSAAVIKEECAPVEFATSDTSVIKCEELATIEANVPEVKNENIPEAAEAKSEVES